MKVKAKTKVKLKTGWKKLRFVDDFRSLSGELEREGKSEGRGTRAASHSRT
jgi:hypothetical protein